ncbi:MAG: hypothetical protein GTO22_00205 [Gemmatimonadales bacterium]|nr:hypothetical protein [Gemmatimonadales bacterium]
MIERDGGRVIGTVVAQDTPVRAGGEIVLQDIHPARLRMRSPSPGGMAGSSAGSATTRSTCSATSSCTATRGRARCPTWQRVGIVKNPDWATPVEIPAPILDAGAWRDRPDRPRRILIWEDFDRDAILADFFATMREFVLAEQK